MNILKNSKKTLLPLVIGALFAGNVIADNSRTVVDLGLAGDFTILSKTGITDVYPSAVTGSVGSSPITGAAIHLECTEIAAEVKVYSVDAAGPSCKTTDATKLTGAIGAMEIAYTDAAGRSNPDETEVGAGEIGSLRLVPGLYKWSGSVGISNDLYLDAQGDEDAVWIFQIAGDLLGASSSRVVFVSGIGEARNVFWQVAGGVTIGTGADFQGVILSKTLIAVQTDAKVTGRLFAQTAVTLQMNTVTPFAVADDDQDD
jgi:hypothetical protein